MKACRCKRCHRDVSRTERGVVRTTAQTRRGPASSETGRGLTGWKGGEVWAMEGGGKPPGCVTGWWMHPSTPRVG